jgi:monofunctional chorismate mutase
MAKELQRHRNRIDRIDRRVVKLLKKRFNLVKQVGRLKKEQGLGVVQPEREEEIMARIARSVSEGGLRDYITAIYSALFKASYRVEEGSEDRYGKPNFHRKGKS